MITARPWRFHLFSNTFKLLLYVGYQFFLDFAYHSNYKIKSSKTFFHSFSTYKYTGYESDINKNHKYTITLPSPHHQRKKIYCRKNVLPYRGAQNRKQKKRQRQKDLSQRLIISFTFLHYKSRYYSKWIFKIFYSIFLFPYHVVLFSNNKIRLW